MPRYWIGHAATSAAIGAGITGFGLLLDNIANAGSMPYIIASGKSVADIITIAGPIIGLGYFAVGIPRVVRQERRLHVEGRHEDLEDIGIDTAEYGAMADRNRAHQDYLDSFRRRRPPRVP